MTMHSPAPWSEFETDDGDFGVRMDKSHEVVFGNLEGSCGICHANARLTSLAPELLDTLEKLAREYRRVVSDELEMPWDLDEDQFYIKSIALIEKAHNDLPKFI